MNGLFYFPTARQHDPVVDAWLANQSGELGALAQVWFGALRRCGDDVRELLHDGYPTACVGGAAFGYVGVFKTHVNVGFFRGADLPDPAQILTGTGKLMRHVKLRPGSEINADALQQLIAAAYADMKCRARKDEAESEEI